MFGADIAPCASGEYVTRNIFEAQPFMAAGVVTDEQFKVAVGGAAVDNLYGCGAILSGYNPVKEGCGAGVAMFTALKVAENILNR